MQIQVNTDSHIAGTAELTRQVEAVVKGALGRFADRITRVEVHLTDDSSRSNALEKDKRCVMEARVAGLQPIAVSHQALVLEEALSGAADKLETSLDRTLGRLDDPKGRTSYSGDQTM
jgi:ribosome-associated translation inhibitor RaiA